MAYHLSHISYPLCFYLTGQDLTLENTLGAGSLGQQLFQRPLQTGSLGRNGDHRPAIDGNILIDGQNVYSGTSKYIQYT